MKNKRRGLRGTLSPASRQPVSYLSPHPVPTTVHCAGWVRNSVRLRVFALEVKKGPFGSEVQLFNLRAQHTTHASFPATSPPARPLARSPAQRLRAHERQSLLPLGCERRGGGCVFCISALFRPCACPESHVQSMVSVPLALLSKDSRPHFSCSSVAPHLVVLAFASAQVHRSCQALLHSDVER